MMAATILNANCELGSSIPANTPHAVSVSLPTWADNVDYEEGRDRVIKAMACGYPRFFIHKDIQKLMELCIQKFGLPSENCILMPSRKVAERCRDFLAMNNKAECQGDLNCNIRIAEFSISSTSECDISPRWTKIFVVLFPANAWKYAKAFWQHTGDGISSRYAEYCLRQVKADSPKADQGNFSFHPKFKNHHYAKVHTPASNDIVNSTPQDSMTYIEERYGRNLNILYADEAKIALRRRIAGALSFGETDISEDDVYLRPTGMSAIYHAHRIVLGALPPAKSVCFGFPYIDTLKILQKFGPGCYFYGNGQNEDLDDLESLLDGGERILALFCEFPGNPLLKSPDLIRIRSLADKFNFAVVVDETIGNFLNVHLMPYVDILVSSLTKVFSGDSNVMGGSLILNPRSKYYSKFKSFMNTDFEDTYWMEDAIFMERNSRTYRERIDVINKNAEAVCDYLTSHPLVDQVYYPKYVTRVIYEKCMNNSSDTFKAGYGGLFSVVFKDPEVAHRFFDALPFCKGPSLGTNFTLACPYTILAHYTELDWAEKFGVRRELVRFSVGLEDTQHLLDGFRQALDKAS